MTDIELLQAKENAEQISAELAAYIDAIGALALISITDRKGNILLANKRFCEISGYTEEELLGNDHNIVNSGAHPKAFFVDMWATISSGKIWHKEICNRNKKGEFYWVDSTIVPIKCNDGNVNRYLSVRVDVTERKKKDLELHERLKESNCLKAIRHDLGMNLTIDMVCEKILNHLIQGMKYPEIAVATVEFSNKRFSVGEHAERCVNALTTPIIVNEKNIGQLKVAYIEEVPFILPEEQNLLDTIAHDLSKCLERKEAEQRITDMATHDELTGLPNRHLLQDRIKQVLAHNHRNHQQMAVLFIDLDHFKVINDSLGHDIGDLLLQEVSARLVACIRKQDTVARQGGDEFIVVLHTIANSLDASSVAQKLLDALVQPYRIKEKELHIGGSIGISIYPDDGNNADTLLRHSDIAMYHAKELGRNNYQFFTKHLNQLAHEKHALSEDLHHALACNQLCLYFQPIIDMPGYKLLNMEVLLRWKHPEKGIIPPNKFIPLAEENGLIIPIGEWVLRATCKQIKIWQDHGYKIPRLAINLSAKQFQDEMLVENMTNILNETGVDARLITLEITEGILIDNIDKVVITLNNLSEMGFNVSIDDFGTGYSSLSYLKRFPISTLKIDRSFVRDILTDPCDHAIVAAIIAMANSLSIKVIAEGVETDTQLDLLIEQGCDRFQGYYFSKPEPAAKIEHLFDDDQISLPNEIAFIP